jgi:hypothetical protein
MGEKGKSRGAYRDCWSTGGEIWSRVAGVAGGRGMSPESRAGEECRRSRGRARKGGVRGEGV